MKINKSYGFIWVLVTSVFIGCASQEEPSTLSEKTVSAIFKDMNKLPAIEDPDPIIEDPNYGEIFDAAYSMRLLDEISVEGQVPLHIKEILKAINEHTQQVRPEIKEKFKNVTVDFLVGILDPRVPLDPQLEDILKKMLEAEKLKLSLMEVPVIEGMKELDSVHHEDFGRKEADSTPLGNPSEDGLCAQEIYIQYGSGARTCGQNRMNSLEIAESNYLRRVFEADERFEKRNILILDFGLEKLPVVVGKFRKVLGIIKEASTKEEVEEIRKNIGYLAAVYAYHLRINMPLWYDYGLTLNEWYYAQELELIAGIRVAKEAEVEEVYNHCINWVNGLIIEEVRQQCPGDEPVLY